MENNIFKKVVIVLLVIAVFIMSYAYALLYKNLRINGNAEIVASWNVGITGIREGEKKGNAYSNSIPTYTTSTATFDAKLESLNDSIEYIVTISNQGRIDATLADIVMVKSGNPMIQYEVVGVNKTDVLKAGESVEATIRVFASSSANELDDSSKGNVVIRFSYIQKI